MSRRRWRHRAAASLLRSRRRSRLRISSGVISSVRILLLGPGKRRVVFACPLNWFTFCCDCHSCQSWLLSSSEKQSLLCANSFSNALSVDSIFAIVVGVKTRFVDTIGITQPICRCTQSRWGFCNHQCSIGLLVLLHDHVQTNTANSSHYRHNLKNIWQNRDKFIASVKITGHMLQRPTLSVRVIGWAESGLVLVLGQV